MRLCFIYSRNRSFNNHGMSDTKDSLSEIEKYVESDHCSSGNDHDIVDKK